MKAKKETKRELNRRDFIKNTAVGIGTTALVGLGSEQAKATPHSVNWLMETDVVVVGSGGAGLCAAIEAADAGASVLIVEKADHVGGLWISAGGHAIMGATHVLAQAGVEDHLEWWYEDEMKESDHRAVPELVRTYVEKGPETMLWLEQLGLKFIINPVPICPGHRINRSHWPAASPDYPGGYPRYGGISWITVLMRAVQKQNIPVLLKHRMTRIFRLPGGPVAGVEVDHEGKILTIRASKGVILAAGGYADNTQLCMSWDPRLGPDLHPDGGGPPTVGPYVENVGDAHRAALEVGAALTDMSFVSFLPIKWGSKVYWCWEPRDWTKLPAAGPGGTGLPFPGQGFQRVILTKNDGLRYVNEAEGARPENAERPKQPFTAAYLNLKERPRNVWAVTDADGAKALKWDIGLFQNPNPMVFPALYPDCVAVADSLQELASKMGIPAANLEATVNQYNGFVAAGNDEDFGKPMPLYSISNPPFFGAKLCMLRHTQPGGLRINTKAQVLDRSDLWFAQGVSIDEEMVIPHLYAAGECGGFLGWRHTHGKLGNCATFGRIAGKNAAAERSIY